jgi:hypothetical protein
LDRTTPRNQGETRRANEQATFARRGRHPPDARKHQGTIVRIVRIVRTVRVRVKVKCRQRLLGSAPAAIFRGAFTLARLTYFNPHSFRKALAQLGERVCRTPEELKAWSQNLGHEDIRNLHQASEPDMDAAAALKALETIVRRTTSGCAAAQNLGARKSD